MGAQYRIQALLEFAHETIGPQRDAPFSRSKRGRPTNKRVDNLSIPSPFPYGEGRRTHPHRACRSAGERELEG